MKKNALLKSAIAMMMSALLISGCSSAANQNTASTEASKAESEAAQTEAMKEEKKFSVVSTIFPSYDWVKEVIGDRADSFELTLLLDKGTDLHSYQPTAEDIAKISKCDLFIYVGGESDYWVADALKESTNPKMQVINLVESIGDKAKEEEIVEGMEGHDHDHDDHGDHDH
ncbi:MAG: metal ABC transporter substrate-binding protein, partial [Johnsonella sp.]|nr:metal ABC transporter substrate-binding protein [Johnsonella sp.]